MKIILNKSNQIVIEFENGTQILFSYDIPVAAFIPGAGYVKTSKKWSVTTSKHVNKWIGKEYKEVPQEYINRLTNV